jgi:hypothetical protein
MHASRPQLQTRLKSWGPGALAGTDCSTPKHSDTGQPRAQSCLLLTLMRYLYRCCLLLGLNSVLHIDTKPVLHELFASAFGLTVLPSTTLYRPVIFLASSHLTISSSISLSHRC